MDEEEQITHTVDELLGGAIVEDVNETEARVYKYGCLKPIVGYERVLNQMQAAHQYQQELTKLELCRRATYREFRNKYVKHIDLEQRVAQLEADLGEIRCAINKERQTTRSRVVVKGLNDRAKQVGEDLRLARAELKEARKKAKDNPQFAEAIKGLDERARIWERGLRALTPCFWGTYLLVEAAMKQVRRSTVDPTLKRYRGEGRIGVQIQGGMSCDQIFEAKDNRVRLVKAGPEWQGKATSARGFRRKVSHLLYIRTGSEMRQPIMAVFPMLMHRPLPEDANIKYVTVKRHMVGLRESWSCSITYTHPKPKKERLSGCIAIDLGWRKRPDDNLRVAYWVDDKGNHGEVKLPDLIRIESRKADDLREICDVLINRVRNALMHWIDKNEAIAPEFLLKKRPYMPKWMGSRRFVWLWEEWAEKRFDGDRLIYAALQYWHTQWHHLMQWERDLRDQVPRHRRERYRIFAAWVARTYGTVVIEDFNLAKAKRRAKPEEEADAPKVQRHQMHMAAPGEFRDCVKLATLREGGEIITVQAAGTTSTCHACGGVCVWDQSAEVNHVCEHCGALWDQDLNAAMNLLKIYKKNINNPVGKVLDVPPRFEDARAEEE